MRKVDRTDAILEYGVRFVPVLDGLELDHAGREGALSPGDALAKKLEALTRPRFDGVIRLTEELGFANQDFHFKDLQDVRDRYETQEREHYQKTFDTLGGLMNNPADMALLSQAAESKRPEQQRLKAAFEKAYEKMVGLEAFLSSGGAFKVELAPMKPVLTLPDVIARPGDAVFVVTHDGKSAPALETAMIAARDFHGAFFSKADFSVGYEITAGAPAAGRDEKTFHGLDASEPKVPAGAIARGLNKLTFNTKAAAVAHIGGVLDAREAELKVQLKQLRAARKQLGKNAP